MAEDAGLDLVEVAPNSRPPVCKILDYGRFKYEQKKKTKGKPKSQASVLKEVRVRPKIDVHDLEIKIRKAREFLDSGHKVQVTCLFRGREMAYQNIGRQVMLKVARELEDVAKIERDPSMEGRRMNLLLGRRAPGTGPKPTAEGKDQSATAESVLPKTTLRRTLGAIPRPTIADDEFADLPSVPAKPVEGEDAPEAEASPVPDRAPESASESAPEAENDKDSPKES